MVGRSWSDDEGQILTLHTPLPPPLVSIPQRRDSPASGFEIARCGRIPLNIPEPRPHGEPAVWQIFPSLDEAGSADFIIRRTGFGLRMERLGVRGCSPGGAYLHVQIAHLAMQNLIRTVPAAIVSSQMTKAHHRHRRPRADTGHGIVGDKKRMQPFLATTGNDPRSAFSPRKHAAQQLSSRCNSSAARHETKQTASDAIS